MFLWGGAPMLVALVTFIIYSGTGNELRPNIAFTALALFNVMRFPLNMISMIINLVIQSQVPPRLRRPAPPQGGTHARAATAAHRAVQQRQHRGQGVAPPLLALSRAW